MIVDRDILKLSAMVQNTNRSRWEADILLKPEPKIDQRSDALMHLNQHILLSPLVRQVNRKFLWNLGNKGTINKFVIQSQKISTFVREPTFKFKGLIMAPQALPSSISKEINVLIILIQFICIVLFCLLDV